MTSVPEPAPRPVPAARPWLVLALILAACAVSMSIRLNARDTTHTMETVTVASSQETWLRWHEGERGAWLLPFNEGQARVRKPPLLVWLNMLVWADLDPQRAEPASLVGRARLLTLFISLVTLAAVFWAGMTLADLRTAAIAALAVGSCLLFQRQARTASYDAHMAAWTTLAVAAALWAIGPAGPPPGRRRQSAGWAACAAALALAVYSKNPIPIAVVIVPAGAAVALAGPGRRRWPALGLLAASCAVAGGLLLAWYAYANAEAAGTATAVRSEFRQPRPGDAQPVYYYLGVVLLVAPWSIWLVAGLIHPFVHGLRGHAARLLVPWLWFMGVLVLCSIPEAKQQRYILPVIPAAGLLIAALFRDHQFMAERGERDRGVQPFVWLHWIGVAGASVVIAVALAAPTWPQWALSSVCDLLGRPAPTIEPPFEPIGAWPALAVGAMLLGLALLGWRAHARWRPHRAAVLCGAWGLAALAAIWQGYGGAPSGVCELRAPAEAFRALVGPAPVYRLYVPGEEHNARRVDEHFRLYFGRSIPRLPIGELEDCGRDSSGPVYVLAADDPADRAALARAGFAPFGRVQTDFDAEREVWVRESD